MKILVVHDIPEDAEQCYYDDGDSQLHGRSICSYHTLRDRTHGRKSPVERNLPKCKLFNEWLDRPYTKCASCRRASQHPYDGGSV